MGNYINGFNDPEVIIKGIDTGNVIETISLDMCNLQGGMTESYEENFRRKELESGQLIDFDFKGCRIIFTLDYSQYARKANLFLIEKIIAYSTQPDTYSLWIRPRADNNKREFKVKILDGIYELGILPGGINTVGHKLPVIKFITENLTSKIFDDPDDNLTMLPHYLKSA